MVEEAGMMVLFIDNYDSFIYNLYQQIGQICKDIQVVRNDEITIKEIEKMPLDALVISSGPGYPKSLFKRFATLMGRSQFLVLAWVIRRLGKPLGERLCQQNNTYMEDLAG